jgi:hypothetical protein
MMPRDRSNAGVSAEGAQPLALFLRAAPLVGDDAAPVTVPAA